MIILLQDLNKIVSQNIIKEHNSRHMPNEIWMKEISDISESQVKSEYLKLLKVSLKIN